VLYISVRNVVLENEWNVECEWPSSQTNLESGRIPCMISRRVVVSVFIALMNALPEERWHSSWTSERRAALASTSLSFFALVTFFSS
jgi:hypothetical protein